MHNTRYAVALGDVKISVLVLNNFVFWETEHQMNSLTGQVRGSEGENGGFDLKGFDTLVSQGCCSNELPQTRWHKTSEIYSLIVWKVEVQNQDAERTTLPPKSPGETLSLPLPASGGSWHSLAYGHISHFASVCTWPLPSVPVCPPIFLISFAFTLIPAIGFKAHQSNPGGSHLEILSLMTSGKTLFPSKVVFLGSRAQDMICFWEAST